MTPRTAQQLQAQLYRILPADLRGEEGTRLEAVWYGLSRVLERVEGFGADLLPQSTILQGGGIWLQLHARLLGVTLVDGETDEQLRIRMQNTQDRVTPPAILKHVNDLLSTVTEEQAVMLERPHSVVWEESGIDEWPIWWLWNAFVLGLPLLPVAQNGWVLEEGVLEDAALDAGVVRNSSYGLIETAVAQCRAAGITVFYLYKEVVS